MPISPASKKETRNLYKNRAEEHCAAKLREKGWSFTKRGWPDFFVWKDDIVGVVEVKRKKDYKLRRGQARIMKILTEAGIPCYRYSPDAGFSKMVAKGQPKNQKKPGGSGE